MGLSADLFAQDGYESGDYHRYYHRPCFAHYRCHCQQVQMIAKRSLGLALGCHSNHSTGCGVLSRELSFSRKTKHYISVSSLVYFICMLLDVCTHDTRHIWPSACLYHVSLKPRTSCQLVSMIIVSSVISVQMKQMPNALLCPLISASLELFYPAVHSRAAPFVFAQGPSAGGDTSSSRSTTHPGTT